MLNQANAAKRIKPPADANGQKGTGKPSSGAKIKIASSPERIKNAYIEPGNGKRRFSDRWHWGALGMCF
jgi:hypothetical protein